MVFSLSLGWKTLPHFLELWERKQLHNLEWYWRDSELDGTSPLCWSDLNFCSCICNAECFWNSRINGHELHINFILRLSLLMLNIVLIWVLCNLHFLWQAFHGLFNKAHISWLFSTFCSLYLFLHLWFCLLLVASLHALHVYENIIALNFHGSNCYQTILSKLTVIFILLHC